VRNDTKIILNILDAVGGTPLIRLNRIPKPETAEVLAKLESLNPGGSVKDRIACAMIEDAEKKGLLKPGSTVIEPTSGNTGIGLAMVCAVKRYKCILTMPETMSMERIYILKAYGAEVILTPGNKGMKGAIKKAEELSRKTPHSFMPHQFEHHANPEVHRQTTAKEILAQTGGELNAFVAGVGTGGTKTGVGEVLKAKNPGIRVIAVEPEASAVLSGKPHGPHKIQGIGAGFIPDILNRAVIDEIITVSDKQAYNAARLLAREEGIFGGPSSGAALIAALKIAERLGKGKRVVTVFPDTGERYFSVTQYFEF
jgi:cysteine synthase A